MVTYYFKDTALMALNSLRQALEGSDTCQVVIIDNNSRDGLQEALKAIDWPGFTVRLLRKNVGKAAAINAVTAELFDTGAIPEIIMSMDADITFSRDSLLRLRQALSALPNAGMISMRYEDNGYSPEVNLPPQPTPYAGLDGQAYDIFTPLSLNVAGGVFGITGRCFKKILGGHFYPVPKGRIYCSDDGLLYEKLRDAGCVNGYLEGTRATHHGQNNYLYSDTDYSRWKQKELRRGGSITGYFERNRVSLGAVMKLTPKELFYRMTGCLIESGFVPGWLQRKKRKRLAGK
jgi:GT2 family glycosyltransferase